MEIKIGRQYIKDQLENIYKGKELPNMFDSEDRLLYFIGYAIVLHILVTGLLYVCINVLGIHFSLLDKPEWQTKDIEFVLTQNEAEPINKNTKYRSDRNSRAGGVHDPNKIVSMPSTSASPAPKTSNSQPAKQVQTPKPQVQKSKVLNQVKPEQKVSEKAEQGISRPSKVSAPSAQKPVMKPSAAPAKPQMPKLAQTPNSPFKVAVPNTGTPVGKGFSTSSGTSSTGGGTSGSSSGSGSKGSGMPAPQFSTTRTGASGSSGSGSSKSGNGGYGTGNMGNPGPGNPNGAPGIDAIKAPQWGPYMRALESKIKQNWHPPKGDQSKRVVLNFKIGRKGELLSVSIAKSSGSSENDQAAIRAVQMSAPFRPLPPEYTKSSVEINFTFDYTVLGASYK